MSEKVELTKEEQTAINRLKRLEKCWPKTLWLFATVESLLVMKKGKNGEHVTDVYGYMDQEYIVASYNIENDGGDF